MGLELVHSILSFLGCFAEKIQHRLRGLTAGIRVLMEPCAQAWGYLVVPWVWLLPLKSCPGEGTVVQSTPCGLPLLW